MITKINDCTMQAQEKGIYLKRWAYRLIMPLLMVMFLVDCTFNMETYFTYYYNWLIPLAFLFLLLAVDRWHPAFLLVREDILIVAALLISPLRVLETDWLSGSRFMEEFMHKQGYCIILFFIALYLRWYHEEDFYWAVRLVSIVIWFSAVIGLYIFFLSYLQTGSASSRLYEPYGHPIIAANCWIMGLWMPLTGRRLPDSILKIVNLTAIFLSQSRSSWIALIGTIVLFLFHMRKEIVGFIKRRKIWQVLLFLSGTAAAAWGFFQSSYGQKILIYIEKILLNRLTGVTDSHAYYMRTTNWTYIINDFLQSDIAHFLFGYGLNGVDDLILESGMDISVNWLMADNTYVSLTYEFGLISTAAVVLLITKAMIQFMRTQDPDELMKHGTLAIIGMFAVIFFYDVQDYEVVLLPASMLAAETLVDFRKKHPMK